MISLTPEQLIDRDKSLLGHVMKDIRSLEAREEDNFTQIMHLKERVCKLDRWFNIFIIVNMVIAALYLIT